MQNPVVLIVGEGGRTVEALDTQLQQGGLRVQRTADCGGAFEAFMTSMDDDGHPAVEAVVLDVERAGFGTQEFRAMLRQEHPTISLLDLPPDSATSQEVGVLARALLGGLLGKPAMGDPGNLPSAPSSAASSAPAHAGEEFGEPPPPTYAFEDFNSRSPKMRALFDLIPRIARTGSAILVRGETGTGKELVAAAIHRQSRRRDGEFFTVNCGAMTESLLESELFGHERGAFTGAVRTKKGYFELASGGTLFLDELGTISTAMQVRLLRVLETMEVRRVGGEKAHKVDVRIVAATNESLEEAVREGTFRKDLYYRLNVVTVRIPPLRDRPEDIPLLAQLFVEKFSSSRGAAISPASRLMPRQPSRSTRGRGTYASSST